MVESFYQVKGVAQDQPFFKEENMIEIKAKNSGIIHVIDKFAMLVDQGNGMYTLTIPEFNHQVMIGYVDFTDIKGVFSIDVNKAEVGMNTFDKNVLDYEDAQVIGGLDMNFSHWNEGKNAFQIADEMNVVLSNLRSDLFLKV